MVTFALPRLLVLALAASSLVGCTGQDTPPPETPDEKASKDEGRKEYGPPPAKQAPGMGASSEKQIQTIEPGKVVPAFRLTTVAGDTIDSADVVGKKPFVVMFFASWCGVCEQKLPLVQKALTEEAGDMLVLGAALDEPETWHKVAPYMERHGLQVTLVRGQEHKGFAMAYDPFGSVPLVMVINQEGVIVDLQRGVREDDEHRLRAALQLVQKTTL